MVATPKKRKTQNANSEGCIKTYNLAIKGITVYRRITRDITYANRWKILLISQKSWALNILSARWIRKQARRSGSIKQNNNNRPCARNPNTAETSFLEHYLNVEDRGWTVMEKGN